MIKKGGRSLNRIRGLEKPELNDAAPATKDNTIDKSNKNDILKEVEVSADGPQQTVSNMPKLRGDKKLKYLQMNKTSV